MTIISIRGIPAFVKTEVRKSADEIEAEIELKSNFLKAAKLVAGAKHSSAAATKVAGIEASNLQTEIEGLQRELTERKAA